MNIGELYDILTEKLGTGEFSRFDPLYIYDGEDIYTVADLEKCQGEYVNIVSEDLEETMLNFDAEFAAATEVPPVVTGK